MAKTEICVNRGPKSNRERALLGETQAELLASGRPLAIRLGAPAWVVVVDSETKEFVRRPAAPGSVVISDDPRAICSFLRRDGELLGDAAAIGAEEKLLPFEDATAKRKRGPGRPPKKKTAAA